MRRVFTLVVVILIAAAALSVPAVDLVRGASFLTRAAGMRSGWQGTIASVGTGAYTIEPLAIPSRVGPVRARVYRPRRAFSRTILLTAGVHKDGIDEARLVNFARQFAASGLAVITPELPDLLEYRITPRLPDLIEDAARWASGNRRLARDGRVGLVGISFSGGLSVVAAGRAAVRDRIAFTLSLGGHGNLPRTLRYLCTGRQPDGTMRPPHDYGVVIILLNAAHLLVPPEQVTTLRAGILAFLRASSLDMLDKAKARVEFDRAIAMESDLPEPSRTLLHYVNTRDVKALGPILLPIVGQYAGDPSFSPEVAPAPRAPVFLLHGADDNVIPAIESMLLAANLATRGTPARVLLTPLITHAEVDRHSTQLEIWKLVRFWTAVLRS